MITHYYIKNARKVVTNIFSDEFNDVTKSHFNGKIILREIAKPQKIETVYDDNYYFNYKETSKGVLVERTAQAKGTDADEAQALANIKIRKIKGKSNEMVQILDKLIDTLISKGVITANNLPSDFKQLYQDIKALR